MRVLLSGIEAVISRVGMIPTFIITIALPMIIILAATIIGHLAVAVNIDVGFKFIEISNKAIDLLLTPIIYAPIKLLIIGTSLLIFGIIFIGIISPTFFEGKIIEKNSRDYVLYKLKGDHEIAEKIEKKMAELMLKQMKSGRARYY